MNSPTRCMPSLRAVLALGAAIAAYSCMDDERVAGSSVTTGNPTEIQVGFTDGGSDAAFTGTVSLYGSTQIPVPGFQPAPLDSWSLSGAKSFDLLATDLAAIPDSLWPKGSTLGDSLRLFNLVAAGDSRGSITRNLAYRIKQKDFALADGSWKPGKKAGVGLVSVGLAPRAKQGAFIDPRALDSERSSFLYLPGTGYVALSADGRFEFPSLPEGSHQVSFLSVPKNAHPANAEDSVFVYGLNLPLVSGKADTLASTGIQFSVPTPSEYRPK